jgi:hypothetical protein
LFRRCMLAICLYGAWVTWTGGSFLYPFIGRRMAQGFRRNRKTPDRGR